MRGCNPTAADVRRIDVAARERKERKGKGERGRGLRTVWVRSDQVGGVFGSGRVVEHTGQAKDREREREGHSCLSFGETRRGYLYDSESKRKHFTLRGGRVKSG